MGTITNANRLVQAAEIAVGDILPGIDTTRHIVVGVNTGRNLLRGLVVRLTTAELLPSGRQSGVTYDTDFSPTERRWVEN